MITETWNAEKAAEWLGISVDALRAKAKAGSIPGFKAGKEWRFIELDLIDYARGEYKECPSQSAQTRRTGGATSRRPLAKELENLLDLPKSRTRNGITTN